MGLSMVYPLRGVPFLTASSVKAPVRVIWSACHTGPAREDYLHGVIDRAAAEGVSGIELSGTGIEPYIGYRDYPALAAGLDRAKLADKQAMLDRLTRHAADAKLRFGLWHHEIHGPRDMMDRVEGLKAADGLIDLDSPALYKLITARLDEFFDLFPRVDELVLTMTETRFPVFRRPFCAIPVAERVRRLLHAVLAAVEPRGKRLVIRPFSALREDELHVREAVEKLDSRAIAMMYKTEPFDWHPFLMNEPLIGSIPTLEARAETDSGAEYYGQGVFPCSYIGHLEHRLAPALEKGARTAVIRVDRGAHHPALGHPINEANVLVPTRWLMTPGSTMPALWSDWFRQRHGASDPGLFDVLEKAFDVIKGTLYIDRQSFTHRLFPDLTGAKHVQAFGLFEESVPLSHMSRNWGILSDRTTLTHEQLLAEKEKALALAESLVVEFDSRAGSLPDAARVAIRESLARLPLLARACRAFCRVCAAHLEDVWKRPARSTDPFALEATRMLELADRIERERGADFWLDMPACMRNGVNGLVEERSLELPLRQAVEAGPLLEDYVLCGFASEGHRLRKMLHTGRTVVCQGRCIRETGVGADEGIGYQLASKAGQRYRLTLTVAGDGDVERPGVIRIGNAAHAFNPGRQAGFVDFSFEVTASADALLPVAVSGSSTQPCRVAQIRLDRV
jgi:hypothetical protein